MTMRYDAMKRNEMPAILNLRERAKVINNILKKRLDNLLPSVMRETGFDMWLIICHEDNYDPIFQTITPYECWAPILQIVVFYDKGNDKGIERLNISRTNMHGLMIDIWDPDGTEDQWECLKRVVHERNPKCIGINQSEFIWASDGITATLKEKLIRSIGNSYQIKSAEKLCIRWLETHIPEELVLYHQASAINHSIIKECFSRKLITPGVTTCEDLRWYYWQRVTDLGLKVSFPPFFRILRSDETKTLWGEKDPAIRMGDILHCDVGIEYMRLIVDHQELAYVLRPGETDVPKGLKDGMAQANKLQDIFTGHWKKGLTGNEILNNALKSARDAGIGKPKIYSHSLGHFLHEPGPLMGLPWEQVNCQRRGDVTMNYNTCYTVELSVTCPVPEWNNQEVPFMLEQDAGFTENGIIFFDGRQETFHLV